MARKTQRGTKNRWLEIALGVVTSIGGFLDAGSMATAAQAGARFRFQLIWAVLLGALCAIFLAEMCGRLAAVSHHPLRELIHKRFGVNFSMLLLAINGVLNMLVLASEIGGLAIAAQLISGVSFGWWVLPAAAAIWVLLWSASFGVMEKGISFAGLITVVFVVGAFKLHPGAAGPLAGMIPRLPSHDPANYWYTAVSIVGSIITPYVFFFYSSGAIEDRWDKSYLPINRAVAALGMGFGSLIAIAIMTVAAMSLAPRGIAVENYHQAAIMLNPVLGTAGVAVFAACLSIASLGAAVEVSLSFSYELAQTFGWNWGKSQRPRQEARFTMAYSAALVLGALILATQSDPLKLTVFTMALSCVALPFVTFPFLILMNDASFLGRHTNARFSNIVIVAIVAIAFLLAVVAIPLQVLGG